jgi:putative addiction module antidote
MLELFGFGCLVAHCLERRCLIMTTELTLRKVGNSVGLTLPKELLTKLRVNEGDTVFVTETPEGLLLSAYDPDFEAAIQAYAKGNAKYKNTLRQLAK